MVARILRDLDHTARSLKEYDRAEMNFKECIGYFKEVGVSLTLWFIPNPSRDRGITAIKEGQSETRTFKPILH